MIVEFSLKMLLIRFAEISSISNYYVVFDGFFELEVLLNINADSFYIALNISICLPTSDGLEGELSAKDYDAKR